MSELSQTFSALSDPTRLAVIDLLSEEPRCSSALAEALETSRPAMSRHLGVLRKAGLVEEKIQEEDARVRLYHLRRERFTEVRGWLEEVEAFWADQLEAFRAHVVAKKRSKK